MKKIGRLFRTYYKPAIYAFIAWVIFRVVWSWLINTLGLKPSEAAAFGFQVGFQLIMTVVHILIYFGFFFWFLGGRIRLSTYLPGDLGLTWDDYVGNDAVLERLRLLVHNLTSKEEAKVLGGVRPSHMILSGPPGTGKTYAAKVIASMANVPVMVVECSSLLGTFVGIGPLKTWNLFIKLLKWVFVWGGAILVADEIDTIAMARSAASGSGAMGLFGGNWSAQILNVFLGCLSGLNEPSGIWHRLRAWLRDNLGVPYSWTYPNCLVIGITNRFEVIDTALLRPGRLEEHIEIGLPDYASLQELIVYYMGNHEYEYGVIGVPHDDTCDVEAMAWLSAGTSQAGIESGFNKAKRLAAARSADRITIGDWAQAVTEARMGLKQPLSLTGRDIRLLSTHEAGHAFATIVFGSDKMKIPFATIERYGHALGHVQPVPVEQHILQTGDDIERAYAISLASLAAERVAGVRTPGTSQDLDNVKRLTMLLISQGIIGDPWMIKMPKETAGRTVGVGLPIAELSDEGQRVASTYYHQRLKEIEAVFREQRQALDALSALLADKKSVTHAEIEEAIDGLWSPCELKKFEYQEEKDE